MENHIHQTNEQEQEILDKYRALLPELKRWAQFVDNSLNNSVLAGLEVNIVQIPPSFRVKDERSYLYKALYRKKEYGDPLKEIEDKVGTRIVVLKSTDVQDVSIKVQESLLWKAKITKDLWQEIENKPQIFNYQSLHIVVSPADDDNKFQDTDKELLTCEIQIRTLLQHAFAEVSHDSAYKGPYKNDKVIMRQLSKSMALMEATDDYFLKIFGLMMDKDNYFKNYLVGLVKLYQQFCPDFSADELDDDMSDAIFELLDYVKVDINDLDVYVEKHNKRLNKIVSGNNSYRYGQIVKQPIFILINYFFDNHHTVLRQHWPLSQEALKKVFEANSTSFESY